MAKQSGPVFITGTVGGICFYEMNGKYYARKKSSLSRKRVKRDPKFERTMRYAGLFGKASRIAAEVYRLLCLDQRNHAIYRELTGQAQRMLKKEVDEEVVRAQLVERLVGMGMELRKSVWEGVVREDKVVERVERERKSAVVQLAEGSKKTARWAVLRSGNYRTVRAERPRGLFVTAGGKRRGKAVHADPQKGVVFTG